MGYQPRAKTPKRAIHAYRKSFRQKGKVGKRSNRRVTKQGWEEKTAPTEQEVFEATIKRLHTLGSQKFGSSPFSEHFDRWIHTVEAVLCEFESRPEVSVDEQFVKEKNEALAAVKLQLENRHKRETHLEQQVNNLSDAKSRLQQLNNEYLTKATALKGQKNTAIKHLNKEIATLKKEQDRVINLKTGFFRGLSKKEREQKELEAVEKLNDKQQELELLVLSFRDREKQIREEFERKREPILDDVKVFKKRVKQLDEDGSLEERWFTCEALIDVVNNFFQRK
jgi:myosin heavy subunit